METGPGRGVLGAAHPGAGGGVDAGGGEVRAAMGGAGRLGAGGMSGPSGCG